MGHLIRRWQDKGARRVWRWILLIYSLLALALTAYAALASPVDLPLAVVFLAAAMILLLSSQMGRVELTFALVLLLVPVLPYGLLYGKYYVDGVAARSRGEFRVLGVPFVLVSDGEMTPYYRKYIGEDLPPPVWLPCFKGQIGLGAPHVDYFTQGIASADSELGSVLEYYAPDEATEEAITRIYFKVLHDYASSDERLAARLAQMYAMRVSEVFRKKGGEVQPEDLGTVDDLRADLDEREGRLRNL